MENLNLLLLPALVLRWTTSVEVSFFFNRGFYVLFLFSGTQQQRFNSKLQVVFRRFLRDQRQKDNLSKKWTPQDSTTQHFVFLQEKSKRIRRKKKKTFSFLNKSKVFLVRHQKEHKRKHKVLFSGYGDGWKEKK